MLSCPKRSMWRCSTRITLSWRYKLRFGTIDIRFIVYKVSLIFDGFIPIWLKIILVAVSFAESWYSFVQFASTNATLLSCLSKRISWCFIKLDPRITRPLTSREDHRYVTLTQAFERRDTKNESHYHCTDKHWAATPKSYCCQDRMKTWERLQNSPLHLRNLKDLRRNTNILVHHDVLSLHSSSSDLYRNRFLPLISRRYSLGQMITLITSTRVDVRR